MPLTMPDVAIAQAVAKLTASSNSDRTFDAAQMQLVNLTEIIQGCGRSWGKVKQKIRSGSMQFLKGCLGNDDIVIPAGDGFLIIFAEKADQERLKERADELRQLLIEFYLGEDELKRLNIKVKTMSMPLQSLSPFAEPPPPPPGPAAEDDQSEAPLRCLFAPVWTPQAHMIGSYLALPIVGEPGAETIGYTSTFVRSGKVEEGEYHVIDLKMLDRIQAALAEEKPGRSKPAIGVCVHSTTMRTRSSREAYLQRLKALGPSTLQRLFIKIAEIEGGTPMINLADWSGLLRLRVRHVLLEFHHSMAAPPDIAELGVWGAGYAVSPAPTGHAADRNWQTRQIRRWAESLRRQGLRFFIDGIDQEDLLAAAAEAGGAQFITSDYYWPFENKIGVIRTAGRPVAQATVFFD